MRSVESSVRIALLTLFAACSGSPESPSVPPTPTAVPAKSPIANVAPSAAIASAAGPLDPLLVEPASGRSCDLRWSELKDAAPPTIALLPANGKLSDECAESFDPKRASCAPGDTDCFQATMRGGHKATLSVIGPEGSGRFETLGLSIDGKRFACITASTVGWRYLVPVADKLAPLPWLADVDGDKDAELIVWQRLPWGDSEVTNALVPVVYVLDGDRLVRRDDRAKALRVRVADAYHVLASRNENPEAQACFSAVTAALGG
jgi:hypothetical protein